MKSFIIIISIFTASAFFAQNSVTKTMTLAVRGNCDECKERIENAADIKGVKLCVWNETTQKVTVTYRPDKIDPTQIEKAIAASGHDAGNTKAAQHNYDKLPSCCKYRDKKCEEKK